MRRNMQATKTEVSLGRRNATCKGMEAERIRELQFLVNSLVVGEEKSMRAKAGKEPHLNHTVLDKGIG